LIFVLGLAVLGWTQWWWPGILVLVGLMMLLGPHGGRRHCWW
jgi:hypothetical protein